MWKERDQKWGRTSTTGPRDIFQEKRGEKGKKAQKMPLHPEGKKNPQKETTGSKTKKKYRGRPTMGNKT